MRSALALGAAAFGIGEGRRTVGEQRLVLPLLLLAVEVYLLPRVSKPEPLSLLRQLLFLLPLSRLGHLCRCRLCCCRRCHRLLLEVLVRSLLVGIQAE